MEKHNWDGDWGPLLWNLSERGEGGQRGEMRMGWNTSESRNGVDKT